MVGNAVGATLLVNAALLKLLAPEQLRRALAELVSERLRLAGLVPVAGIVEFACGVSLLETHLRVWAAIIVAMVGMCFAVLGIAGKVRRSVAPCGCMGTQSDKPFGLQNVIIGTGLAALLLVNFQVRPLDYGDSYSVIAMSISALLLILMGVWSSRELAFDRGTLWAKFRSQSYGIPRP